MRSLMKLDADHLPAYFNFFSDYADIMLADPI